MSSNEYQHADTIEQTELEEERTDNYKINWIIPKFQQLVLKKKQQSSMAPEFQTMKNYMIKKTNSKFHLKMSFRENNESIKLFYRSTCSIYVKYTISISNNLRYSYSSIPPKSKGYHKVKANRWQRCSTNDTDYLYDLCNGNTSLHIVFNFEVSRKIKDDYNNIPQLSNDFENLLTDSSYSDAILKSFEGVEFKVHKSIICVRSKVLKAHFEHDTSESRTNLVETAWETEVLQEVLTFVYTDKSPQIKKFPEKLLAAADYYQLERLKRICEEELADKLTVENAIDTLQLADLHSADGLRESTLDFIKFGRISLVTETQGWKNIQSVELVKKIYEYVTSKESDNSD